MNRAMETTYALLIRSEEVGRSIVETIVYAVLGLSVIVSILLFVQQQDRVPASLTSQTYGIPHFTQHQAMPVLSRKS